MAIPTPEDAVVTNAKVAIDKARKALDDPEFVKRLKPGEKATYESRIKDAEDALKAYGSANPGGPGMFGTTATMRGPTVGVPAVGIGIAVMAVIGYMVKGSVENAEHKALALALGLLLTQNQQITARPNPTAVDDWILAAGDSNSHNALRTLMAAIFLQVAKVTVIIASIRKDIDNNPGCCGTAIKEFEEAAKSVLIAAMNPTMVPSAERLRRANTLLDKILALYKCLNIEPPLTMDRKVTAGSSQCRK